METRRFTRSAPMPASVRMPDRKGVRTQLSVACDVVSDDPRVVAAFVVLPRRLQYRDLGPFQPVQQAHNASLHLRDDGGFDIVVDDVPDVPARVPAVSREERHAPAWVMHLMQMTEGVR